MTLRWPDARLRIRVSDYIVVEKEGTLAEYITELYPHYREKGFTTWEQVQKHLQNALT